MRLFSRNVTQTIPTDDLIVIKPGMFQLEQHFYPQALNTQLHPDVEAFFQLDRDQIAQRYRTIHPNIDANRLSELLNYQPRYLHWAGADLLPVNSVKGERQMVVVEINSCPSGQKSMPLTNSTEPYRSYRLLIEQTFLPMLLDSQLPQGGLAVIYDKNWMEVSGYAATIADLLDEPVYLVNFQGQAPSPYIRFEQGIMYLDSKHSSSIPIRAAFRYVTQQPWNRIPIETKTAILNPVVSCLTGGRNKLVAHKAYTKLNNELKQSGLQINIPSTICDVNKSEIPDYLPQFDGRVVVKVPYSNAGQGIFTITNAQELNQFMAQDFKYDCFIVQELIGHQDWLPQRSTTRLSHIPIIPRGHNEQFVADLRMMIGAGPQGFYPLVLYARRANQPLCANLLPDQVSRPMLCTNLSYRRADGQWDIESDRLLVVDKEHYPTLNLNQNDLIEIFVQTLLATIAVDKIAVQLMAGASKSFQAGLSALNPDTALLQEIFAE